MKLRAAAYWAASILYMAAIFYLSSGPAPNAAHRFPIIYKLKLIHMIEYGALTLLLFLSINETWDNVRRKALLFSFSGALIYGVIDEFHQSMVPSRSASPVDIVANLIGAGVVLLVIVIMSRGRGPTTN